MTGAESETPIEQCDSILGHKWLNTYRKEDGEIVERVSRRCARCEYVDDDPPELDTDQDGPDSLRCRLGWHSYRETDRINHNNRQLFECKRCGKWEWR